MASGAAEYSMGKQRRHIRMGVNTSVLCYFFLAFLCYLYPFLLYNMLSWVRIDERFFYYLFFIFYYLFWPLDGRDHSNFQKGGGGQNYKKHADKNGKETLNRQLSPAVGESLVESQPWNTAKDRSSTFIISLRSLPRPVSTVSCRQPHTFPCRSGDLFCLDSVMSKEERFSLLFCLPPCSTTSDACYALHSLETRLSTCM